MTWWKKLLGKTDDNGSNINHENESVPDSPQLEKTQISPEREAEKNVEIADYREPIGKPKNIPEVGSVQWRSQPLFISSTFVDMMAERDYLRDFVFPDIAERLRARQYHLEPVDLRWGVETVSTKEHEHKELLVLKVCLDEIERCKPFMIALLGDRYGWIPPEERMQAAVDEKGFNTVISNKSVTAVGYDLIFNI